jgi:hypothetical protein
MFYDRYEGLRADEQEQPEGQEEQQEGNQV